jgi:hypothetical protein
MPDRNWELRYQMNPNYLAHERIACWISNY